MSDRYAAAGVDYTTLDGAKRRALEVARALVPAADRDATVLEASRGEPAIVLRVGAEQLGFVLECLGTKSLVARDYEAQSGIDCFEAIGYDTVCAIVNDCVCVGALPFVVNVYFATGSASFYEGSRATSLVAGFARGCVDAGAAWGGGESPTLTNLVAPDAIDLAGAAIGRVPKSREALVGAGLSAGDEIVLVSSSGLHANGVSLVRAVAGELPDGLMTRLSSGRVFGEAVLDASAMYVSLMRALLEAEVALHYASHITGHGLRKLMRAARPFTYRVHALLDVPEVLSFLLERAQLSLREAYATFNMGCGFALFVGNGEGGEVVRIATALGHHAVVGGVVEHGERQVILEPIDTVYESDELEVR